LIVNRTNDDQFTHTFSFFNVNSFVNILNYKRGITFFDMCIFNSPTDTYQNQSAIVWWRER